MRLYLDEKQAALDILEKKDLGYKPFQSLCLLAKHYLYVENLNRAQTEKRLIEFIDTKTKIKYIPSEWDISIRKAIEGTKKHPQIKIENIVITKSEVDKIQQLDAMCLRKLAFTLLCLAKYHNQVSDKNNNWTNCHLGELFRLANVWNKRPYERLDLIRVLSQNGYITYSKTPSNTNICVCFINNTSDSEIVVTDMKDLGKQYSKYCGNRWFKCEKCGKLFKPKTNNSKFCRNCQGYTKHTTKTLVCVDCGKELEVEASSRKIRCDECHKKERSRINANYRKKDQLI